MPSRQSMRFRADIEQNTEAGKDPYGHLKPPVYVSKATDVPCLVYTKMREEIIDGDKQALVEEIRALFSLTSNVVEADRIASIKDRLGVTLFAGPMIIETIQRRRDHFEMMLKRVESET